MGTEYICSHRKAGKGVNDMKDGLDCDCGICSICCSPIKPTKQHCTQCEIGQQNLELIADVERLKEEKQKLLEALRPVAIIGNKVANNISIREHTFLSPSGYKKAFEVYNEVIK